MLHVCLLGEQSITDDVSGAVRTQSSHTIALITYLALHAGAAQSRQQLAGVFWPESTEKQALTNLRRELHTLRQVLGDEPALEVTPKALCWRDTETCRVDLCSFEKEREQALLAARTGDDHAARLHATAALAQYRGELLPGRYDEWLLEARADLDERCVRLCELVCAISEHSIDLAPAVSTARLRVRLRPLEEVGYRTLMRLQAELGDRAGAVSTYHHCASVLERELGVDPDPTTRSMFEQLLTPESLEKNGERARTRTVFPGTQLVGRESALDHLRDTWAQAATGSARMVLVRGDAGVGKTRLVGELAEHARRTGAVAANASCFGSSGRLALAPVADWLRNPTLQAALPNLEPVWRAEVSRILPLGADHEVSKSSARAMVDTWQRHRFFEGLARALLATTHPVLLALDNVQWCDQESLAFVTFLLRLDPDAPLLVAGTLRDEGIDEDPEPAAWVNRIAATGILTEVELDPLDLAGTTRLAELLGERSLSEQDGMLLQAATGGFPLHIVEAARNTAEASQDIAGATLPADLGVVLRHRIEQAGTAAREVAELAAAVGRNFTLDLLAEASDLDADTVVRAVDELWRRRIVREFREGYDFAHDLLRTAAYDRVSPPRRWLLHRRIAQALELLYAEDTDPVSGQLAEQYARAGRTDRAVAYYRRAAEVAAGVFAHVEAVRLHHDALALLRERPACQATDRQELAVLRAMAAPLNARSGYASAELRCVLERLVTLAERLGDTETTAGGLAARWATEFVQGRMVESQVTARRALTLIEPESDLSAPAHFACGGTAVTLGAPRLAVAHFAHATELASATASLSVGTRPDVHGRAWAAHAHWLLGDDEAARTSCREAVTLARTIRHPYSLAVALGYAGVTHQIRGDVEELAATVEELEDLCRRYGFAYYREWALILRSWCESGVSGVPGVQRGIDNLRADGAFARMPYWLSLLADTQRRAGEPAAAAATLDAALVDGHARSDLWWLPEVRRIRASYDDRDAAFDRLHSAAELASRHGSVALLRRCEHDLAVLGG